MDLRVSLVFLLTGVCVQGVPQKLQKYSVEANGQLALTEHSAEPEPARNSSERGVIRREPGLVHRSTARAGSDSMLQQQSSGSLKCGWTFYAPDEDCPAECPLMAEESWNPCHFQCVTEDQCGSLDAKATVADYSQKRCRACIVAGCDVCAEGGEDKCHKCSFGYFLDGEGQCYSATYGLWTIVRDFGVFILAIFVLWIVELAFRRPTNLKGLKHGLSFRSRTRNHLPHDALERYGVEDTDDPSGMLYPLSTNLVVTPVGGAGTALHFGFQVYVIVWAGFLAFSWVRWASVYGYDLIKLGTLPARTPQELCSVVRWGARRQEEMFEYKFNFIIWAYLFQFCSCIAFALFQRKRHNTLDNHTTLKDYACYVHGLPSKLGEEDAEGLYKDFLERETGQKLVGVSIAWDLMQGDDYEELHKALEIEGIELEKAHALLKNGGEPPVEEEQNEVIVPDGGLTKVFKAFDNIVIKSMWGFEKPVEEGEEQPQVDVDKVREILEKLKTSDVCFAVFETEEARDAAVQLSKETNGFAWDRHTVNLESTLAEPSTVLWQGMSHGSRTEKRSKKLLIGWLFVAICLALWTVVFYLPYAYYVSSFTYANGEEPSFTANVVFTILVVAGNQAMYFVADAVATWAEFGFEDERQFWYNVYYLVACLLNVVCDLGVTGYLSYKSMVAVGAHSADGTLLESMTSLQDIVESYPMQKSLGRCLFCYCFPGTFLTPFLIEPLFTVVVPYFLSKWVLRSHKEFTGRKAELAMSFFIPMDMGRYSDILLNMCLASLVLFLPGGFILPMFLAMTLSHIWIYCYDHWRLLRSVPKCHFATTASDKFASNFMALPCAITASCAVFKGYHIYYPSLSGWPLACVMLWAFLGHLFVHEFILKLIYKIQLQPAHDALLPYSETAKSHADTWFSVNPVHCLRSKYIWGHSPAQVFHMAGKEHLQTANEDIGAYYENKEAQDKESERNASIDEIKARAKLTRS